MPHHHWALGLLSCHIIPMEVVLTSNGSLLPRQDPCIVFEDLLVDVEPMTANTGGPEMRVARATFLSIRVPRKDEFSRTRDWPWHNDKQHSHNHNSENHHQF